MFLISLHQRQLEREFRLKGSNETYTTRIKCCWGATEKQIDKTVHFRKTELIKNSFHIVSKSIHNMSERSETMDVLC